MPPGPYRLCYGRDYPRAPRGVSGGYTDGNWPSVWKVQSGPVPGGLWSAFDGLFYWDANYGSGDFSLCSWLWKFDPGFHPNIRVQISPTNPDRTEWRYGIDVYSPGFGGGSYGIGDQPWGQPTTLALEYVGGAMPGWTNKEDPFVLSPATYSDLPADFCEPRR